MLGDGLVAVLPFLPGVPFAAAAVVTWYLWVEAIKALRAERADHINTQQELDVERDSRRNVEDKMDDLTREVRGLKAEIIRLRALLGEAT